MTGLNMMFDERLIGQWSEEVLGRLERGDDLASLVAEMGDRFQQFSGKTRSKDVERIINHWPAGQLEMIRAQVIWGLKERKKGIPIKFHWKGDDEHPETITRIESKDNDVYIEFLHPPFVAAAVA